MMSFWVVPASWCGDLLRRQVGVLLLGDHLVHREQPHRDRVDRHRGVHLGERDLVEELAHLAEVRHGYADLADLAARAAASRGRSRSGSGGRRRPTARSGPWRGCCGRARWTPRRSSARRTSASPRAGPSRVMLRERMLGRATSVRRGTASPRVGLSDAPARSRRHGVRRLRGLALDLDDPDQAGQVEQAAHGGAAAAQDQVVAGPGGLTGGDGQHLERGDVDASPRR